MAMVGAYIGSLETTDRFNYEGGDYNGNLPSSISPSIPLGREAFSLLFDKIRAKKVEGRQVDWGGFVGKMKPAEIKEFLEELIEKNQRYIVYTARSKGKDLNLDPNLSDEEMIEQTNPYGLKELFQFIDELNPEIQYALVAYEY